MKIQAVTHGKNLGCCLGIVNSDWELIPAAGGGVFIGVVVQPGNFLYYCQKNELYISAVSIVLLFELFSGVILKVSSQKETSSPNFYKDYFNCSVALNLRTEVLKPKFKNLSS